MDTDNRPTSSAHETHTTNVRSWFRWLDTHIPEARPTSVLFAGTMVVSVSNYVFNFLFGRLMSPGDYGLLVSLLSLAAALGSPTVSFGMLMTQRAAIAEEHERATVIRRSMVQILQWGGGLAVVMAVVIWIGGDWLPSLLNVPETGYLILAALLIETTLISSGVGGLALGLEKFSILSASYIAQGLGRIIFGLGLLGLGVAGIMTATPLSYLLATVICASSLISINHHRTARTISLLTPDSPIIPHLMYLIVTQAIIGFLHNSDVIMARRYLDPGDAGLYAALSVLGKTVLYLPAAVGAVLFPRISRQLKQGPQGRPIKMLLPGLTIVLGISLPVIGLFSIIPTPIITLLYGDKYLPGASLLGGYGLAMLPLAINGVISQYFIAFRSKIYTALGGLSIIVEWRLLATANGSLARMVLIVGIVNTIFTIIALALTLRPAATSKEGAVGTFSPDCESSRPEITFPG